MTRLVHALRHRRRSIVVGAMLAALAASLPSLWTGFYLDDHVHQYGLRGLPGPAGGLNLYDFTPVDRSQLEGYIRRGPYPWWTSPDLKARFFRPLSSALMWADSALFGENAVLWHVHSIAWGLALVASGWLVLRRLVPGLAGPLALCFFAVAQSHAMPVVWIANRNALVAVVPALLGFAAHLRWRQEGWRPGAALSLVGYAIGLCGGEAAVGILAYPVAWELVGQPGPRRDRLLAALPAVCVALAYAVVYKLGDYGARNSGVYLDPTADPLAYAASAPSRLVALLGSVFVNAPVELWLLVPSARPYIIAESLAGIGLAAWLYWRSQSGTPAEHRSSARFFAVGVVAALAPTVATFPMTRLALPASLAGAGLLALFARSLWLRGPRFLLWLLLITHIVISGSFWPMLSGGARVARQRVDTAVATMEVEKNWERLRVVVLTCPDPSVFVYLPLQRAAKQRSLPNAWWWLTQGRHELRLTRTAANAFELEVLGGRLLASVFEQVFRSVAASFSVGDSVPLEGAEVKVFSVQAGFPTRISFSLDVSLDDPEVRVLWWKNGTFRRFPMPAVGQTAHVPFEEGPMGL